MIDDEKKRQMQQHSQNLRSGISLFTHPSRLYAAGEVANRTVAMVAITFVALEAIDHIVRVFRSK